jgi:hypothetical protein
MTREKTPHDAESRPVADGPTSPERRNMIRRLVKAGSVLPVAAVIYNASATVAAAS